MSEEPEDFERHPAPSEGGGGDAARDGGEGDARDAAREESGRTAEREGQSRGGDERRSTGNPASAGEE